MNSKDNPFLNTLRSKKKGKIVGSYLSFINLNLIVEFGRTASVEILNVFILQYLYCQVKSSKKRTVQNIF